MQAKQIQVVDVAVIGGSIGGVQAALSAVLQNKTVYLCEETDWIGGQLTSQAVPPDEHPWIEECGRTKRYQEFREAVRNYYRNLPDASKAMKESEKFCPGGSWVSRIAHEPKVAYEILMKSIDDYLKSGQIILDTNTKAVCAEVCDDVIKSVDVETVNGQNRKTIAAQYFLDGTDCGDLLPLVGAEYRVGAESRQETNEPHAPLEKDRQDMQPCTWVAAIELAETQEETKPICKPPFYEIFSSCKVSYDDNMLLSWYGPDPKNKQKTKFFMFDEEDKVHCGGLWRYRRIIKKENYQQAVREVTLFNWPQNDYSFGNIFEDENEQLHKKLAKELTWCALYWLKYEAPHPDGTKGYPIQLRPDITGTEDGFAMTPYIRESRRIVAQHTICEQEIAKEFQDSILWRKDSVGVGHYAIDIHPTTKTHTFFYTPTWPFEIPLSAMIPIRLKNLIPACKNIGCTHLTNGCFRLHPVEWNVGEVAGYLAAYCVSNQITPKQVLETKLEEFQTLIQEQGVQLHWNTKDMVGFEKF